MPKSNLEVALITGAARRVGACIAKHLHTNGYNVIVHYLSSQQAAEALVAELNRLRANSAVAIAADLNDPTSYQRLINDAITIWGRIDVLVNNASRFYPTQLQETDLQAWNDLMASNLQAPFFLAQAALPELRKHNGSIINIVDIHAQRPIRDYSVYCIAKAGLQMLTKALAKELGPDIRVNAVAPGSIMWPEGVNELSESDKQRLVSKTCLRRHGNAQDIADTVHFLLQQQFITGQVIAVDGGRTVN